MFEIGVTVRNMTILERLIARLKRQPRLVQRITERLYDTYKPRIEAALAQEPPPRTGPVDWTSERQRVTVLAILRRRAKAEGRSDIRYIRTHALSRSYRVAVVPGDTPNELAIAVTNPTPYLIYVKWQWQQRFHAKTGWQRDDVSLRGVQADMVVAFADIAVTEFREGEA